MSLTHRLCAASLYARLRDLSARASMPLRRIFWLLMVAAHAPGLISAWRSFVAGGFSGESFGGCLLVTLAMLFFGLKLLDAGCLRFRTDRRSGIALCMIVALLHVDVIRPDGAATIIPEYTTLFAASWLAGTTPLLRRRFGLDPARAASTPTRLPMLARSADTAWLDAFRPHCWLLARRVFHLRAPPT